MVTPSNPTGQPKYALGNSSDGLTNALLAHAASGHQVFPRIGASDGLRIVLPAPAATTSAFDGLVNASAAPATTSTESFSQMKHLPALSCLYKSLWKRCQTRYCHQYLQEVRCHWTQSISGQR